MLDQIDQESILFLDIETIPQFRNFDMLSEEEQQLWTDKSRFSREKKGITVAESYPEAGIYAEFGKVLCIGVGYFAQRSGERIFRVRCIAGHDEHEVLQEFASLLESGDRFKLLCAHNGKEFDFPYLCRRMLINRIALPPLLDIAGRKPWEIAHLDTMELWKFGDYKHYTSIRLLSHVFGIPTPKDDIDGSQVSSVYYEENDIERISRYCMKDVVTVARVFQCYKGQDAVDDSCVVEV